MDFATLIHRLAACAAAGDGTGVAACFTPHGTYHDVFYGAFTGAAAITEMIEDRFHRDAEDFVWDMHDPVSDGAMGYARYVFSYTSRLPDCAGRRAMFEGVAICALQDGLITDYHEVANPSTGLSMLGFADQRIAKIAARQGRALAERAEMAAHRR